MKAMVFAAGLGTRLRPLTDNMPKALVPVGGVPMLQHVILNLKRYGFEDIIVNIHHFGQQVMDFLAENGNFGISIHISDERGELLETGGGILKAREFFDDGEPFLVHNADVLTDLDLSEFYKFHLHNSADATLLTAERVTSRYLLLDNFNRLNGWINVKTGEVKPAGFKYEKGKYNSQAFMKNWPTIIFHAPAVEKELTHHQNWKNRTQITATPTLLVNGYILPPEYSIEDLLPLAVRNLEFISLPNSD